MPENRVKRYPNQGSINVLSTDTSQTIGVTPTDVEYFPIRGMVRDKPSTQLVPGEAWTVKNMYWRDGQYKTRPGVSAIGGVLTNPVCGVIIFTSSSTGDQFVVAQPAGFSYYDGSAWTALTGTALTATVDTLYSFTQWGSSLIYANGVDAIGAVDMTGLSFAVLTGAPVARTVFNFGRRIIGCDVGSNPERVQWCVSGNNADWSGLGSGYEDLRAAPGGVVDDALIGIPITDDSALLIKRRSIWIMTRTGFFDTPFAFSRRYQTLGTESPNTFKLTPIGVIGLFLDNVYVFTDAEPPRAIGTAVRNEILRGANLSNAVGIYDRFLNEYRLFVPKATRDGTSAVWRYSISDARWTFDEFPFDVVDLTAEYYTIDPTIDGTEDVVDSLDIPVDAMEGVGNTSGLLIAQYGSTGKVVGQLLDGNTDDITQGSVTQSAAIETDITLGEITPGTSLRRANIIEAQIEHFNSAEVTLDVNYSEDFGTNWSVYDQWLTGPDGVPTISRFTKYVEAKRLLIQITSADAAGLALNSIVLRLNVGSKHAH